MYMSFLYPATPYKVNRRLDFNTQQCLNIMSALNRGDIDDAINSFSHLMINKLHIHQLSFKDITDLKKEMLDYAGYQYWISGGAFSGKWISPQNWIPQDAMSLRFNQAIDLAKQNLQTKGVELLDISRIQKL